MVEQTGFGAVHQGKLRDVETGSQRVVTVLRMQGESEIGWTEVSEADFSERYKASLSRVICQKFTYEARVREHIGEHRNVVSLLGFFILAGTISPVLTTLRQ